MKKVPGVSPRQSLPAGGLAKRGWLYGGLAVTPGVAMVRRGTQDERTPRLIVPRVAPVSLVGERTAAGLAPTMQKLLADRGRKLFVSNLSTFASRPVSPGSLVVLADVPVDVVLAAAPEVHRAGGRLVVVPNATWTLSRPAAEQIQRSRVDVVPVGRLRLPVAQDGKTPTAAGFAALAGAIWTYIR